VGRGRVPAAVRRQVPVTGSRGWVPASGSRGRQRRPGAWSKPLCAGCWLLGAGSLVRPLPGPGWG
jgi:hypothetical protein